MTLFTQSTKKNAVELAGAEAIIFFN